MPPIQHDLTNAYMQLNEKVEGATQTSTAALEEVAADLVAYRQTTNMIMDMPGCNLRKIPYILSKLLKAVQQHQKCVPTPELIRVISCADARGCGYY